MYGNENNFCTAFITEMVLTYIDRNSSDFKNRTVSRAGCEVCVDTDSGVCVINFVHMVIRTRSISQTLVRNDSYTDMYANLYTHSLSGCSA